jgi:zinc/manganese transport system ATP-binding protein
MSAQLTFENLTVGYERHPAVHHLSGTVEKGALLAIVGPNGAGKSTLLKAIAGHVKPMEGSIFSIGLSQGDIAYLPQMPEINSSFPISVQEMVAMGLWPRTGFFRTNASQQKSGVAEAIAAVGLNGFESRPIGTLSGGQLQRTLFARLMAQQAQLLLLDEPFASLDHSTVNDLMALIRIWHNQGRTIIAALHEHDLVKVHFPQALLLARTPLAWGRSEDVLQADLLARAEQMCEAADPNAPFCERVA